jgi:autotransporter-associated beta strand protein
VGAGHNTVPGPIGSGAAAIQLGDTAGSAAATLTLGPNVTRFARDVTVPAGVIATTPITLNTTTNQVTAFSGNLSLNRTLRLNGPFSATNYVPGATTLSGTISNGGNGPGSLDWFGGNYNLTGNNTFSGGIFVEAANKSVLGLGSDTALGTGPITIANSSSFTGSFRADNGPRSIANALSFQSGTNPSTLSFVGENNLTFTSPTVDLAGGTRTFEVTGSAKTVFTGSIINGASDMAIVKTGGGILKFTGQSTYLGNFNLNAGTLVFGSSSTPNSGPIGRGKLVINGCTFRAEDGAQTINNDLLITSDFAINGMNDITMGGITSIGSVIRRIIVTNSGASTFSNTIGAGAETGGINKDGPSTLTFTGDNQYTGGTIITAGKLRVSNPTGSGTGPGPNTVMTGGKLEGKGTINGDVSVQSGGFLIGGESNSPAIGMLTLDYSLSGATLTVASGGHLVVGVTTTTGSPSAPNTGGSTNFSLGVPTNNNYIRKIGGSVVIDPGAIIDVDVTGLTYTNLGSNYSYKIAQLDGLTPFSISSGVQFNFTGVLVDPSTLSLTGDVGGNVYLNFTPVPEPRMAAVVALFGCLTWSQKRASRRHRSNCRDRFAIQ